MKPANSWSTGPTQPHIHRSEVHIWRASLDAPRPSLQYFWQQLSTDEVDRAQRFHFDQDRNRFIMARGILRCLLGRYLRVPPSELRFNYGPAGKPELALHHNPITFNVSHSNRLATYAVGHSRPVGIDIEYIRETPDTLDAIYHCLADEEREQLSHVPTSRRAARLFAYWASKEAFLKATGRGLQIAPSSVVIHPPRKQSPALTLTCRSSDALTADQWTLSTLDVHPEFAGSVCARGAVESYSYWEWSLVGESGVSSASR